MARNPSSTIYIGNLDEKVTERVLYEILIQAGRIVDLHMPRDRETNKLKGYAFCEYETIEIAEYAIKLFSGLVRLHNKTLKFAFSGREKPSQTTDSPITPGTNSSSLKQHPLAGVGKETSRGLAESLVKSRSSAGTHFVSAYAQASSDGFVNRGHSNRNFEYSRRVFGAMVSNISHPGVRLAPHTKGRWDREKDDEVRSNTYDVQKVLVMQG